MESIRKFKKSQKGSITIMVLTSMLFMLVVITASYLAISNESIGQNKKISQISKQYQVTDDDMRQEYQKIVNGLKVKDYVKVGDYVDYEPTKADVGKTQAVEQSKLTYISPTGTIPTDDTGIITHGNGYGEQKFTAKANTGDEKGLKWRVLSVSDDKVELISETPVLKDDTSQDDGNFVLNGGIGYLYAEQELNEICKIYGYGYGADANIETEYTVGGPEDTPIIGKIKGSGARSINIEDLNKQAGIYEDKVDGKIKYSNGKLVDSNYGSETNPTTAVFYPTLSSRDTLNKGTSSSAKSGFKYTYYTWSRTEIIDDDIQDMLKGNYFIASRCIMTNSSTAYFFVRNTAMNQALCSGDETDGLFIGFNKYGLRPVVTLKANVIDLETDYNKADVWRLK